MYGNLRLYPLPPSLSLSSSLRGSARVPPERVVPQRTRESSFMATSVNRYHATTYNLPISSCSASQFQKTRYSYFKFQQCRSRALRVIHLSIPCCDYNYTPLSIPASRILFRKKKKKYKHTHTHIKYIKIEIPDLGELDVNNGRSCKLAATGGNKNRYTAGKSFHNGICNSEGIFILREQFCEFAFIRRGLRI